VNNISLLTVKADLACVLQPTRLRWPFKDQHRPWCDVTPPQHSLGDIQAAGEYLVHGIRTTHRMAGRRIAVLGPAARAAALRALTLA
jgi:hypothetical protein